MRFSTVVLAGFFALSGPVADASGPYRWPQANAAKAEYDRAVAKAPTHWRRAE